MTVSKSRKPHDKCGARKRQGPGNCRRPAGWGTDHVGQGKCKLHGGAHSGTHRRYAAIKNDRIREIVEELASETEEQKLNIFPELDHCRAIYRDFVERYDVYTAALLAWHQSWSGSDYRDAIGKFRAAIASGNTDAVEAAIAGLADLEANGSGKPRQVLDIADAYRILSEVSKIVERIDKMRSANAVSRSELLRVMAEMGRVVDHHVEDDGVRQKIRDGWMEIRIA